MRIYKSFLVRCWLESGQTSEADIYDIQNIQTGEKVRLASLSEIPQRIKDAYKRPVENPNPEAGGDPA